MTKWLINQENITILSVQASFNEIHEAKTDRMAMTNRETTTTDFSSPRSWSMGKLAAQRGRSIPAQH